MTDTSDEDVDLTKFRYALYVRRSSEDESKQVRSLPDQIKDCREFARRNNLRIVGAPFEEKRSAKRAGQRKVFDAMLTDIRAGKYDAILAWAPDRLSRNMLEGGQLINMLDEEELKDMRFYTHHFTNDASGKLTLGIMFSISKHFTDDLSRKVSRGIKGNFSEGKSSGSPKWGYDRDDLSGLYQPNEYFPIIQKAWEMRVTGSTYDDIVKHLRQQGYHRVTKGAKRAKRIIRPTKNAVAKMFIDPFYYGVLEQKGQTVDLREIYNFEPMINEDAYNQVQALSRGRTKDISSNKRTVFMPLRGMVYCAICNDTTYMKVGRNKPGGSTHHVLTYRCDNPACKRSPKSLRAKHIFNSIYERLDALELTGNAYERYSAQIESLTGDRITELRQELASKRGALTHIKKEIEDRSLAITGFDKSSPIFESNERQIERLATDRAQLDIEINELQEKVLDPVKIKLSRDDFLNLVKTAADKMRAGSAVEKDTLCRILFLNLRVDNEKVASYHWREPFASLVKATEIISGADESFYFETRPIEVILADLAESWDRMQRIRNIIYATRPTTAKVPA